MSDARETVAATLAVTDVEALLKRAAIACGPGGITDIHVHATEVVRDRIRYRDCSGSVYPSNPDQPYQPLEMAAVRLEEPKSAVTAMHNRMSEMAFQRAYRNTGPAVFLDQMDRAGVQRAVLLPVAHSTASLDDQLAVIDGMCRASSRFVAGFSVPSDVSTKDIGAFLRERQKRCQIGMLKVHPNICGVDLGSADGLQRIEAILSVANSLRIPVLFHGGCSPILGDTPAARFSVVDNLARIDWSLTAAPVVIAHFGIYGCRDHTTEASGATRAAFLKLLDENPNLFTDTSGISYEAIRSMIDLVPTDRIVFGSDALYVPMYRQVALVMAAIEDAGLPPSTMKSIAFDNPGRVLN